MDQDLSFRVIGRRLVLSAFFACLLFALPVQTSFAQSSERVRPVTINNQKQLENFGISATQIHELNSKVEQFNDRYKTHGSLIPALYLVDLSALEFDKIKQYIVIIAYANTDYLQIYLPAYDGTYSTSTLGDELALDRKQSRYRLPTIELNNDGHIPSYLLVQALDTIAIPFDVLIDTQASFNKRIASTRLNYGLFFGAFITLAIYNFILFFVTRERSYFWYSSYLVCMITLLFTNNGLGQSLIWPGSNGLTTKIGFLSAGGLLLTMTMFVSSFITLDAKRFRFNKLVSKVVMSGTAVCMLVLLWIHHGVLDECFFILSAIQMINILMISYLAFRQKQTASIYLFLGYLILFPAITITILKFTGLLGSTAVTNHAIETCLLIEAFIISIGVGEKIRQISTKQLFAVNELRSSKQKFLKALIDEREREKKEFGVVLHNTVVQNLAVLRTKLERSSESSTDEHNSVIEVVDNTIEDVREISHQSYPSILEQFGLSEATKNYAEKNLDAREIDWSCDIDDSRLENDQVRVLYRIIQESINNTYRHADASKVSIQLQFLNGRHRLAIQDDGCGFDQAKEGFGLSQIKQYASYLDGINNIISSPDSGTLLTVEF